MCNPDLSDHLVLTQHGDYQPSTRVDWGGRSGPMSFPGAEASSTHGNGRKWGALSIFKHSQQICLGPGLLGDSQAWQLPHSTCQGRTRLRHMENNASGSWPPAARQGLDLGPTGEENALYHSLAFSPPGPPSSSSFLSCFQHLG